MARFKRIGPAATVTAVTFDLDGKHLYFASDTGDSLQRIALDGAQTTKSSLLPLQRDFVTYIAQNPAATNELAIATRQRHVFLSSEVGRSWKQIAREGAGL